MYCKQLKKLPIIATDWQIFAACPGCQWYKDGKCLDERRKHYNDPCEFEMKGERMPLKFLGPPIPMLEDL
jgi:hypothetical protein